MKLSEFLKKYRFENGLSQRKLASLCGLSNATIALIENELNPMTNRPPQIRHSTIVALAAGLGIPLDTFLTMVDIPLNYSVSVPSSDLTPDEFSLLSLFRAMDQEGRSLLLSTASAFAVTHPAATEKEA